MVDEDELPEYYLPEEKLRPLLEAIGNALVERLRDLGVTEVVIRDDDDEGRTYVVAYIPEYPATHDTHRAIWQQFSQVSRQFFDETVLCFSLWEEDGEAHDVDPEHGLVLKAA